MVALGSSFAAGPGIAPQEDRAARRSTRNYAHVAARSLGAHLVDATVSDATTATILHTPQRARGRRFAPQVEAVGPGTDLVTITAGGNDLGYIGDMILTAVGNRLARVPLVGGLGRRLREAHAPAPVTAQRLDATADGLERIVTEVRRRAPGARVVLLDYLPVLDDASPGPAAPFDPAETARFRQVAAALSEAFSRASRRTGADLVPASSYEQGHCVGSTHPWVLGLQRTRGQGWFFHPSAAGMGAVADRLVDHLR